MTAPFAPVCYVLVYLELVGDTLNFETPFLLADATLYDCVGSHFCLHLPGQVVMSVVSSEFKLLVNHIVILILIGVDNVGQVGAAVEVTIVLIRLVIDGRILRTDHGFFESKLVLERDLRQFKQQLTNTLTPAGLDLRGGDVNLYAELLQLEQDVLTGSLGVIILTPVLHLVVVQGEEPGNERDEIEELFGGVGGGDRKILS